MVGKNTTGLHMNMRLYQLVGRAAPSAKNPSPKIIRMKIFARNKVVAKSKFWYYMKKVTKAKLTGGEMLAINEIYEKKPLKVKNYGIWLRYDSRTGTHNMYKEFRDTTLTNAVGQMYQEMSGRHRALACNIQIIKTAIVPDEKVVKTNLLQYVKKNVRFPVIRKLPMQPKKFRATFTPNRPSTVQG